MSDAPTDHVGQSPLDRAHALRLRGDAEGALRLAASIATALDDDLAARLLVARLLLDADRPMIAGKALARLCDDLTRRGDLPMATVAAHWAQEAGGFGEGAFAALGEAFGSGSSRLSEEAGAPPPPLPEAIEIAPFFGEASGDTLLERAEVLLTRHLETAPAEPRPLPVLPLFGQLAPTDLSRLLAATEVRAEPPAAHVVRQGEEGRRAFVLARGLANVVREGGPKGQTLLAALGPGAIFGEMALVSAAPRAGSVVAVEPLLVLAMDRERLEGLAAQAPAIATELGAFCHRRMLQNLVRHSAILSAVDPGQRAELIERFRPRQLEPGAALVREGQEASSLYLLASGSVQVQSRDAEGDRVILAELGAGDVVGEISLVLRRPANADVVAVTSTVALELTHEQFQAAIREHPTLLRELYDVATQREEETRTVVAQEALDVGDVVLL